MPLPTNLEQRKYMFKDDIKFVQKAVVYHPSENKILALKRASDSFARPNCWDFPGGNVLFGRLHLDSLISEIDEETSLKVEGIKPVQVTTNYDKEKGIYFIFIGYKCTALSIYVKISHEHSEYKWVTKEEFLKLESSEYLVELIKNNHDV